MESHLRQESAKQLNLLVDTILESGKTNGFCQLQDESSGQKSLPFHLTQGSQRKTAFALRANAEKMIREAGVNCIGFMTLTVGNTVKDMFGKHFEQVYDSREASRRINNLNRRLLPDLFERAIIVTERHKSGAIHFHILGVLNGRPDIRTGFDHDAVARKDYRSASEELLAIWAMLLTTLPGYGFGRTELTPVEKSGDAVASYVAKYIEKNICNRLKEDKHKKLVRYYGWAGLQLKANVFEWDGVRAVAWRGKTRSLLSVAGVQLPDKIVPTPASFAGLRQETLKMIRPKQLDGSQAKAKFGPRWAFMAMGLWQEIFGDNDVLPTLEFTPGRYCACLRELDHAEAWWQQQQVEGFRRWKMDEYERFAQDVDSNAFYMGRIDDADVPTAEWIDDWKN